MLWGLSQEQLADFLTPLNGIEKTYIREYMAERGFTSASAKESQDICFIPDGDYARYITEKRGESDKGSFIDENGKILGEHRGIIHYTIGQKKHLGIALGEKMTVSEIDASKNTVTLIKSADYSPACGIIFSGVNFQCLTSLDTLKSEELTVKVRYSAVPRITTVKVENGIMTASFERAFPEPAPGQSAVFYIGDKLVFGAFIDKVIR